MAFSRWWCWWWSWHCCLLLVSIFPINLYYFEFKSTIKVIVKKWNYIEPAIDGTQKYLTFSFKICNIQRKKTLKYLNEFNANLLICNKTKFSLVTNQLTWNSWQKNTWKIIVFTVRTSASLKYIPKESNPSMIKSYNECVSVKYVVVVVAGIIIIAVFFSLHEG